MEAEAQGELQQASLLELHAAYERYREAAVDTFLTATANAAEVGRLRTETETTLLTHYPKARQWPSETLRETIEGRVRATLAGRLDLLSEGQFFALQAHSPAAPNPAIPVSPPETPVTITFKPENCPYCKGSNKIHFKDSKNRACVRDCTHDPAEEGE
jgi:hypothetical protein